MKKKLGVLCFAFLLCASSITAMAELKFNTIEYKNWEAYCTLDTTFQWAIRGSDYAVVKTDLVAMPTNPSTSYRVACRVERWDNANTMGDFKYDSSNDLAQCNYTWSDVYCYKSRHSIDNATNTVEYAVDSFNSKE